MKKLHFGCGSNRLPGWDNYDIEMDISKRLPFSDGCASHIFAEHVIEHITHQQAWLFIEECHRVLAIGGVVRIAIPDVARMNRDMTLEYQSAVQAGGYGNGSKQDAIKAAVFCHGHRAGWTQDMLEVFLQCNGFSMSVCAAGESHDPVLVGVEGHGKVVGEAVAKVETSVVEGVKT